MNKLLESMQVVAVLSIEVLYESHEKVPYTRVEKRK